MKMIKRLVCVLLIAAMALSVMPISTLAKGKYPFIDYNRIKQGRGGASITLQMGDVTIPGKLTNKAELTDAEIDELIDAFLKSRGATPDDVKYLHDAIEKAKRLEKKSGAWA